MIDEAATQGVREAGNITLAGVAPSATLGTMTTQHDDQLAWSWPEPPVAGGETATLLGSLERQRATFAWKAGGLDAIGLRATTAASTLTLGGLLAHLARVEDFYFSVRLLGRDHRPPFETIGWEDDWGWAAEQTPDRLYGLWLDMVLQSRAAVAEALARGGLDQPIQQQWSDRRVPTVRRLLADIIEEYARHVGHADLLRESIDGVVGEDPPDWQARPPWPPLSETDLRLLQRND
jgi:hypothetical protein